MHPGDEEEAIGEHMRKDLTTYSHRGNLHAMRTFRCPGCGQITLHYALNLCRGCYYKRPRQHAAILHCQRLRRATPAGRAKLQEYRITAILKECEKKT